MEEEIPPGTTILTIPKPQTSKQLTVHDDTGGRLN